MTSLNYAAPFTHPATSPIRALLPFANRPGTVSFAGGYPDPALFNVEDLRAASARVNERLVQCLQYSGTEGQPLLRQALAALSAERGIQCDPDQELIVTGGSQQALSLIAQVMLQEGDKVVIESPCFPTTAQALRHTGAQLLPVPSGPAGIDLVALEALLQREQPKMICVVATFSNPVGSTLSEAHRRQLLALALKHRVLVVEDDPYSDLRYQGERVPPLLALASEAEREWVVYLSSLSKTVAPSLRLGWLLAAPELRRRCLSAKQADDLSASPWIQEIAGEYLQAGSYPRHLPVLLQAYGARCRSMCAALREEFGSALEFSEPAGGMFVWARLTGGRRADHLLKLAIDEEVVFVPGSAFYPDPALADPAALRLSFASVDSDLIRDGVSRMARALRQMD